MNDFDKSQSTLRHSFESYKIRIPVGCFSLSKPAQDSLLFNPLFKYSLFLQEIEPHFQVHAFQSLSGSHRLFLASRLGGGPCLFPPITAVCCWSWMHFDRYLGPSRPQNSEHHGCVKTPNTSVFSKIPTSRLYFPPKHTEHAATDVQSSVFFPFKKLNPFFSTKRKHWFLFDAEHFFLLLSSSPGPWQRHALYVILINHPFCHTPPKSLLSIRSQAAPSHGVYVFNRPACKVKYMSPQPRFQMHNHLRPWLPGPQNPRSLALHLDHPHRFNMKCIKCCLRLYQDQVGFQMTWHKVQLTPRLVCDARNPKACLKLYLTFLVSPFILDFELKYQKTLLPFSSENSFPPFQQQFDAQHPSYINLHYAWVFFGRSESIHTGSVWFVALVGRYQPIWRYHPLLPPVIFEGSLAHEFLECSFKQFVHTRRLTRESRFIGLGRVVDPSHISSDHIVIWNAMFSFCWIFILCNSFESF